MKKTLSKSLLEELYEIFKTNDKLEKDKVYIRPYSIQNWKGSWENGSISCLKDFDYYTPLIKTYTLIEEANLIEQCSFDLYTQNNGHLAELLPKLYESRSQVKEKVRNQILLMEKGK